MTDEDRPEKRVLGIHGGNIYRAAERLKIDEDEIMDFSASINPLGVPKSVLSEIKDNSRYLCNYPDPDTKQLRMHIAKHNNINPDCVLCGNGSTELIYLIVRAFKPETVLVPAPTFSEYERAVNDPQKVKCFVLWEKNDYRIDPDEFIAAMSGTNASATYKTTLMTSVDMAFLCNPNNPTGRLIKRDDMLRIAEAARNLKCHLVVDEAFIDFSPRDSLIREVENNPYLIVLRSMTKFYALSGLRLGYCVAAPDLVELMKDYKEPWTVNTLAQVAGMAALSDITYRDESYKIIKSEKRTLEDGFKMFGLEYFPSAANFYLLKSDKTPVIISSLARKGILVRDCSDFVGLDDQYMRIAVKSNRDNMRLLTELAQLCMVS